MKIRNVMSLSAALFVAPIAAGCVAQGEEQENAVMDIEEPGLGSAYKGDTQYLGCWHEEPWGLRCLYAGVNGLITTPGAPEYANTYWQYNYSGTYPSTAEVNWGNCHDPGLIPGTQTPQAGSFSITVNAWNSYWSNYATLTMNCK